MGKILRWKSKGRKQDMKDRETRKRELLRDLRKARLTGTPDPVPPDQSLARKAPIERLRIRVSSAIETNKRRH